MAERLLALAAAFAAATAPLMSDPFSPTDIRLDFTLTDHTGATRHASEFHGQALLLFFGYAECDAVCTTEVTTMAAAAAALTAKGRIATPVLVTLDPSQDTPEAMAAALSAYGPSFVGLTGAEDALAALRAQFKLEREVLFTAPDGRPIYKRSEAIYLIDADGTVKTLLDPSLSPDRLAQLAVLFL